MRHPYVHLFAFKTQVLGVSQPDVFPVNITINTAQGFKGSQLIRQFYRAKITGMPYLVTIFKMFENGIVKVTVGV
jgi:hypothetical protein